MLLTNKLVRKLLHSIPHTYISVVITVNGDAQFIASTYFHTMW